MVSSKARRRAPKRRRWVKPTLVIAAGLVVAAAALLQPTSPVVGELAGPRVSPATSAPEPGAARSAGSDAARPQSPGEQNPNSQSSNSQNPDPVSAGPISTRRGAIEADTAERVVGAFADTTSRVRPDETDIAGAAGDVLSGAALVELQNQLGELAANGWSTRGKPEVRSVRVVEQKLDAAPPEVVVDACIDGSDVTTLDADGKPVGSAPTSSPAINRFRLTQAEDGAWRVAEHSFPDNPACG